MAYSTINKSTDNFNTKLYTGNNSTQSITGVGFKPDWVWVKQRGGTTNHKTSDIVRGVTKALQPNDTDAEATDSNGITSFDSDGFSLGAGGDYNSSSASQVSWNWLAGGSQGSSNTDGSINTTYTSANTTAGFSISSYTGTGSNATVGHGLGVAPKMIIIKNLLASSKSWQVGHQGIGWGNGIYLNLADAKASDSGAFNSTAPTSSVFSVGTSSLVNDSGNSYVAYCFAEKTGYSKFGSYTGNGSSDGAFVYTGFKPAWVMIKRTDDTANWSIVDVKRDTYNSAIKRLNADQSNAENTSLDPFVDILSNGFKLQASSAAFNGSSGQYIYIAFGQSIVGSNNIPATAR